MQAVVKLKGPLLTSMQGMLVVAAHPAGNGTQANVIVMQLSSQLRYREFLSSRGKWALALQVARPVHPCWLSKGYDIT